MQQRSSMGNGKTTLISITTQEDDDDNTPGSSPTSTKRMKLESARHLEENGFDDDDGDGGVESNDVDVEYDEDYYDEGGIAEDNIDDVDGDEDQMVGEEEEDGTEDLNQFALGGGHFLDANGGGDGEEEEYNDNEYEELYEDAGFNDAELGNMKAERWFRTFPRF